MFAGYKITLNKDFFSDIFSEEESFHDIGTSIYKNCKTKVKESLDSYLLHNNKTISAAKLEKDWFPHFDADIFLSHSHRDEELVIKFAGWLSKSFGLKVFIDSCVWGYSGTLLKEIDDNYSFIRYNMDGSTIYDYEKAKNSSSHVHMLLNGALAKMIDDTECLFFINTPNSITVKESVNKTYSPWIYSELLLSNVVRRRKLEEYRKNVLKRPAEESYFNESRDLSIEYDAYTDRLKELPMNQLSKWKESSKKIGKPWMAMDKLYQMTGLFKNTICG